VIENRVKINQFQVSFLRGFWLVVILFSSVFAFSQSTPKGTISGSVVYTDGTPVADAVVYLEELKLTSISCERGIYEFKNIPYARYTVVVAVFGNDPVKQTVELNASKVNSSCKVQKASQQLQEVTVEEVTVKRKMEEQGFAVNVIETKNVEYQSIQANELLDRSAGVRIRQNGGLGSQVQYNINGLTGNSIRIFIDGIPISSYGPSFSLNSIPNSMIERIEVFKGVIPAQLSDDALGGAINVVLKKSMRNSLTASYSFGSFNTHQANVNGAYRNDKNGFTARGSIFYNYSDNSYDVWGEKVYITNPKTGKVERVRAKRFHDNYNSWGGKAEVGFTNVKWADQLLLGVVFSDMQRDVQHGATMEIVYGNRYTTQSTQLVSLNYAKKNFLVDGLDVSVFGSFSHLNRAVFDTVPYIYNWFGDRIDANGDGKWDKWISGAEGSSPSLQTSLEQNLTSRINVGYALSENHRLNLNALLSAFTRDQDDVLMPQVERDLVDTRYLNKQIYAAALESQFFKAKLKTSLFAKHYVQDVRVKDRTKDSRTGAFVPFEHNKNTATTGYGLAASYTIVKNVMLVASAEKAVRLPEGTELFGNAAENIDPSYELKPESSNNLNVGVNLGTFQKKKHGLAFITGVFYRNTNDMIRQGVPSQVSETYRFENLLSVISKGVDAELNYNYNQKIFYSAGASVFNARFNTEFDENGDRYYYYQKRLRNAQYFTANNNVRMHFNNVIQKESSVAVYYNLAYVHEFYRDWEGIGKNNKPVIPTQIVHDLGVAYTFPNKRVTVSFDAKNLMDQQVFDNWALQKPGRAFYVKFNWKFI
jgi:outer membrane receptor protein involved in Fe transport